MRAVSNVMIEVISIAVVDMLFFGLVFLMLSKVKPRKLDSSVFYILSYIAVNAIGVGISMSLLPDLKLIFTSVVILLVAFFMFGMDIKRGVLYGIVLMLIGILNDLLATSMMMLINDTTFSVILGDPQHQLFVSFTNCLLILFSYLLVNTFISKRESITVKLGELAMFILLAVLEIFVIVEYSLNLTDPADNYKLLLMHIGFMMLDMYFITSINRMADINDAKLENRLLQKQNEIQLAHYVELEKNYSESRKIIHDIKKHLAILSELAGEDPEKARQYRKMIEDDVDSLAGGFTCTNKILAIIMSQKIAAAEAQGIEVSTDIEDISFDFMRDMDITSIFANLWDNAIEACERSVIKHITVSMEQRGGFILINFKNTYDGKVIKSSKGFKSTKDGHRGVGLTIIRGTVEKYGGLLNMEAGSTDFSVEITLPVPV